MSRLFVQLYFDEDRSSVLAAILRSQNHTVLTTHEARLKGASDEQQLLFAAQRGMAIITHNRNDFLALAEAFAKSGRRHGGIVIAVRRKPQVLAAKLLPLLNGLSAEEMDDQVYFI